MPLSIHHAAIICSDYALSKRFYTKVLGLRHLAFAVADVDFCQRQLESHGVAVEAIRVDEYTLQRFVFFADPDGLPLELYEAGCAPSPT